VKKEGLQAVSSQPLQITEWLKVTGKSCPAPKAKCNSWKRKEIIWLSEEELLTVINGFKCHFCRSFTGCYLLAKRLVINYGPIFSFKNQRSTIFLSYFMISLQSLEAILYKFDYKLAIYCFPTINPSFLLKRWAFVRAVNQPFFWKDSLS